MIQFDSTDPARPLLPHLPLKRLGPAAKIRAVITCTQWVRVFTHFIGGRTLPCVDHDCPGCAADRRRGRECYLSIMLAMTHEQQITVLPPGAVLQLWDAASDRGNLRGLIVTISRSGKRDNGRVSLTVDPELLATQRLPPAPDLLAHLYQIWGLTPDQMGAEHPLFEVRDQFTLPFESTNGTRPRTG